MHVNEGFNNVNNKMKKGNIMCIHASAHTGALPIRIGPAQVTHVSLFLHVGHLADTYPE